MGKWLAAPSVANLVALTAALMVALMVDLKAAKLADSLVVGLERQRVGTMGKKTAEQMVDRRV